MEKKFIALIGTLIGLFVGLGIGYFLFNQNESIFNNESPIIPQVDELRNSTQEVVDQKLQTCPEEWIQNRMPMVIDDSLPKKPSSNSTSNEYFILNGVRKETTEFDLDWIKRNCSLEPTLVY